MSDNSVDPSGNTEAFRAFSREPEAETAAPSKLPYIIIGGVVAAVIVIALIAWLAL
ncbi:hypothetical protein [Actinoplanes sp. NPDC020271]|uniref:hypothetical protein n=1 Tax=Actinoplanes sp. NPDC020271 TaxID=3363896 RepID=UPI0037892D3D